MGHAQGLAGLLVCFGRGYPWDHCYLKKIMTRKLDQIIVIDIEATCWDSTPPLGQESEIIEIGVCPLDLASAKPLEKKSILVKPEHSTLSEFCTKLTSLTQTDVDGGMPFARACSMIMEKYLTRGRIWASYGEYDRLHLQRQCQSRQVEYPFGEEHINIKMLTSIMLGIPRQVGMAEALKLLHLKQEGIHHRGDDDAWNIARIFSKLLLEGRGALLS